MGLRGAVASPVANGQYDIWFGGAVEHAMHVDQLATVNLLEEAFAAGIVSDPATALRGLASIERGEYPDASDHWDWTAVYPELDDAGFDWEAGVRTRLRELVVDCALAAELPSEWTLEDLVI